MRIRRIALRNYRGVDTCEVTLSPTGVTIIDGPNEVGKTSLAEAIDLLFEYPHDSKHRKVLAARPVHRDAGPEVEVELTTGPYHVVYSKRWHRQPETRLTVHAPAAESLTARTAHERMEVILDETLDRDLYRALRFVQGERIEQGEVGGSATLIGALDAAAAGGSADPEAESTLWQAVQEERGRYFTPTGKVSQQRERLAEELANAEARAERARAALTGLEELGEAYRTTLSDLEQKDAEEQEAAAELRTARRAADALDATKQDLEKLATGAERAEHAETTATHEHESRRTLIEAVAERERELARLDDELAAAEPALGNAVDADEEASAAHRQAEDRRAAALAAVEVADRDREFFHAEVADMLLAARRRRVEEARSAETLARQVLEASRVTEEARTPVQQAFDRVTGARAALRAGCPGTEIEALADLDVTVDETPVHLAAGETRDVQVATSSTIGIADLVVVRVRSGTPTSDLAADLAEAEQVLAALVARYGLDRDDPLGSLSAALDARRDAEREIKQAHDKRTDALADLREEELAAKAENARKLVEDYPKSRPAEPPLPENTEAADAVREDAVGRLREAETDERERRRDLDEHQTRCQELRVQVEINRELRRQEEIRREGAEAELERARAERADDELAGALRAAGEGAAEARRAYETARRDLEALDPENTSLRLENATRRVERVGRERRELEDRRIERKTALREKGEADLQAEIDATDADVERLRAQRDDLERRAAAAWRLFETFSRHREAARLGYVAPYREQIERLARLVFGADTAIEVDPQDFSVKTRVRGGVAVPFESLSTGAREQLGVLARLACAILVNPDGGEGDAGVPVILDDALGSTDPERLRLVAPAFSAAAKQAQVIVMTSVPDRYSRIGDATVVRLPLSG